MKKKLIAVIVALVGIAALVYGILDYYYFGVELQSVGCAVFGLCCLAGAAVIAFYKPSEDRIASRERYDAVMEEKRAEAAAERERVREKNAAHVLELKERAAENGVACCPHCGCTTLMQYRKPWNWLLFVLGFIFLAGIGGLLGLIGQGGYVKCAKCGNIWKP